jgi:hypothetical protein
VPSLLRIDIRHYVHAQKGIGGENTLRRLDFGDTVPGMLPKFK